jgi:transposase
VEEVAEKNERARLLMTQPGVRPITAMAFVLTMGDVLRFPRGKQVASYLGLIPREYSSGGHQRLGSISCSQRSQLFGVAAKHPPLKLELAFDFNIGDNYSQHLFVDINPAIL